MQTIPIHRAHELLRSVFEILWNKPYGLTAREVISRVPQVTKLSTDELRPALNTNTPRYEKIVHIITIPVVQAGWIEKNRHGFWRITQEGYEACKRFSNMRDFFQEAERFYTERRREIPENIMTMEIAQEAAWIQIKKHLNHLNANEIQTMFAELLRAMGYYPAWIAPPEKQRGRIDLIAHTDPLGAGGRRILVQIIHKGQAVTLEGVKNFASILGAKDLGIIVSMGGFTNEAATGLNLNNDNKVSLLDAPSFFYLWETYYNKLSEEARSYLPLRAVNFLSAIQ